MRALQPGGARFVFNSAPNGVVRLDDIAFVHDDPGYTAFAYDGPSCELQHMTHDGVRTQFAYDDAGRMVSKWTPTHGAQYAWRYGGKLYTVVSTIPGEETVLTYFYRGDGKLFQETYGFGTADTRFHWDGHRLIGEEDKDGVLQRTYVQQPGLRYGATLAEAPGADPASAAYRYFGRDAHGSSRAAYAQDKGRVGAAEWLPYGQARRALGAAGAHGFTGQWQSARSGDYLFGLRPYSPGLSRWLTRDPLGPVDGPNMHAYVRANPIAYVDPEGGALHPVVVGGGLGAVLGGVAGGLAQGLQGCGPASIGKGALAGAITGGIIGAGAGLIPAGIVSLPLHVLLAGSVTGSMDRFLNKSGGGEGFATGAFGAAMAFRGGVWGGVVGGLSEAYISAFGNTAFGRPRGGCL